MQTTLLGVAIAIILALVAALVAPLVVDWSQYRAAFEDEASRLTGLTVRVNGSIDARILPSPHFKLRDVAVGAAGREPQIRAGAVELELGLGPLVRGEVRATEMRLLAPQISVRLDDAGALDWPVPSTSSGADAPGVSRLTVDDGRVVFSDAASGSQLALEKLSFNGDIRSLLGPFSGDGAFVAGGEPFSFRISGSRTGDDGNLKVRLGVDPADRPLTTEIEGLLSFARGVPQFDGTFSAVRPVGATLSGGQRVMNDPWQLAGKVQATPAAAKLQEVMLLYGPEERAVVFNGKADLKLGVHPQLDGEVSARQVDVDRMLAAPDVTHRPPLIMFKSLLEEFITGVRPPLPLSVGVTVEAVTVGGAAIQALRGRVRFDGDRGWALDEVAFRAPGFTSVNVSGSARRRYSGSVARRTRKHRIGRSENISRMARRPHRSIAGAGADIDRARRYHHRARSFCARPSVGFVRPGKVGRAACLQLCGSQPSGGARRRFACGEARCRCDRRVRARRGVRRQL